MKIKVVMKDPDTMPDAVREAVEKDVNELRIRENLPMDEAEGLIESRTEKMQTLLGRWFQYSEYLAVEFDTEAMTATVLLRSQFD